MDPACGAGRDAGPAQRRDDIGPEDSWPVIELIQAEPQATGLGSAAAHHASAIVLPAPAGAVRTVSGHHRLPWAISWVIRGRGTAQSGAPGAVISRPGSERRLERPAC